MDDGDSLQPAVGPAAKYFEDLTVGMQLKTQGRTVTHTDGLLWSMFTGDMNPMHVDEVFAAEHGLFGGRFPPGLMVVAIATGLQERLGFLAGTGLAIVRHEINYRKVVLAGDTVHVELEVTGTKRHATKPRGTVTMEFRIVTQKGETAVDGEWVVIIKARDGHEGPERG